MALPAQKKGRASARYVDREPHGLPWIPQQLLGLKRQRRCGDGRGDREDAEGQQIQRRTQRTNRASSHRRASVTNVPLAPKPSSARLIIMVAK